MFIQEVHVRDCVVIKSGRKKMDKPYIAKVASLWQESGGIMMSVFWYYRPDDVEGINISDFQEVYTYCPYYILIQILVS